MENYLKIWNIKFITFKIRHIQWFKNLQTDIKTGKQIDRQKKDRQTKRQTTR